MRHPSLTGTEVFFKAEDIIVSKTDLSGRITYANRTFLTVSEFTEAEVIGKPHSLIRHPDMPRCIFQLLWKTLQDGQEIFAYVVNRTHLGNHYWVFAHITPSIGKDGKIGGYHSNRRTPERAILEKTIIPLYRDLKQIEAASPEAGLQASSQRLHQVIREHGGDYGRFIFSL